MALLFKKKRNNVEDGITTAPYTAKPKKKKTRKRLIVLISVVMIIAIGASYVFLNAKKMQPVSAGVYAFKS